MIEEKKGDLDEELLKSYDTLHISFGYGGLPSDMAKSGRKKKGLSESDSGDLDRLEDSLDMRSLD